MSNKIPKEFKLYQNYPNPFNPITRIKFDLASFRVASVGTVLRTVHLTVFDILGREIATLVNEPLNPGSYEISFDASNYTSGIYFYRLTIGAFADVKKMMLVK